MGDTTEIPVILPHLRHTGAMVIADVTTSTEEEEEQIQQEEQQKQQHYPNNNEDVAPTQGLLVEVMEQQHDSNDHNDYNKDDDDDDNNDNNTNNKTLVSIIFILFVIFGTGNAVLGKLVMIPMYNYPVFLNLWICVLYCFICFIYVIPAWYYKYIPCEQFQLPKLPFAIMGIFDTIFGILVMLSATYLPGPLLVLLAQATIPFSMILSKLLLNTKYKITHYVGATIVIIGIIIVLEPLFTKRHLPENICVANDEYIDDFCIICENQFTKDDCLALTTVVQPSFVPDPNNTTTTGSNTLLFDDNNTTSIVRMLLSSSISKEQEQSNTSTTTTTTACMWQSEGTTTTESKIDESSSSMIMWSFIMILSTIPLTLSSIYKEQYNSCVEIDPIYINFWIGLYQILYSIPLSIPAGYISSPSISYDQLYNNFVGGFKCFIGIPTILSGCHPDIHCPLWGPLSVIGFFVVNTAYSILMIFILKYGNANLMFLALTLTIPISNFIFALSFMPNPTPIHTSDLLGLIVIMFGLLCYRFGNSTYWNFLKKKKKKSHCRIPSSSSDLINDLLLQEGLLEIEQDETLFFNN